MRFFFFLLSALVDGLGSDHPAEEGAAVLLQLRSVPSEGASAPAGRAAVSEGILSPADGEAGVQSEGARGRQQRVLFGVQTSATEVYAAKLRAGLDSWLRDVPAEDRIILGPRCEGGPEAPAAESGEAAAKSCASALWEPSRCDDRSQLCKHLALLDRAQGEDFDWFVTLGEDHVVLSDLLKASLAYLDPAVPIALASIGATPEDGGCGQLWNYSKGSKNGTVPKPQGWVEPDFRQSPCLAVQKRGGLCGGTGIVYSRAAVERLFADGRDTFWARMQPLIANDTQYDTGMSCALMDLGVSLDQGCGLMESASSLNIKFEDPEEAVQPNLIYHVAGKDEAPSAMRRVWMQMNAKKGAVLAERRKWVSKCLNTCSVKGFCRAPAADSQAGLLELGTKKAE